MHTRIICFADEALTGREGCGEKLSRTSTSTSAATCASCAHSCFVLRLVFAPKYAPTRYNMDAFTIAYPSLCSADRQPVVFQIDMFPSRFFPTRIAPYCCNLWSTRSPVLSHNCSMTAAGPACPLPLLTRCRPLLTRCPICQTCPLPYPDGLPSGPSPLMIFDSKLCDSDIFVYVLKWRPFPRFNPL